MGIFRQIVEKGVNAEKTVHDVAGGVEQGGGIALLKRCQLFDGQAFFVAQLGKKGIKNSAIFFNAPVDARPEISLSAVNYCMVGNDQGIVVDELV